MKSQTRLLPRLDQLYLQKKSYQIHRKKLSSIQRSGSLTKRSLSQSKINLNQQDSKSQNSLNSSQLKFKQPLPSQQPFISAPETHMQTIQQTKPGISYWLKKMNPLQKRIKQQQIKQNKRIRQKIKNTMSFIQQSNRFDEHGQHYSGMKKMLSKFSVDEGNNKTKLKCQIALKKINQSEKQKLKLQQSRITHLQKGQSSGKKLQHVQKPKDKQSFLTKRSKILSDKITLISKQNTNTLKDNLIKNLNISTLTRNKSQFTQKSNSINKKNTIIRNNSILKNNKQPQVGIPKIQKSLQYKQIKTEQSQRVTNRLFNNSKLSNLSTQTVPPKNSLKDYKMLKVNYTQPGSVGFRKIPTLQTQHLYSKQKINNLNKISDSTKTIASRIKTEHTQKSRAASLPRQNNLNRFDYQKKRIQRYLKSKSSLTVKDLSNAANKYKSSQNKDVENIKRSLPLQKKSIPTVQQKIQQQIQKTQTQPLHQQIIIDKKQNTKLPIKQQSSSSYFATQIQ